MGLKIECIFLFTGRWVYDWGGLITGELIRGALQYAFGHVSKDLSGLHKLYVIKYLRALKLVTVDVTRAGTR